MELIAKMTPRLVFDLELTNKATGEVINQVDSIQLVEEWRGLWEMTNQSGIDKVIIQPLFPDHNPMFKDLLRSSSAMSVNVISISPCLLVDTRRTR